jgi:MFS transporter, DHA1 family, inner membrane transport protein
LSTQPTSPRIPLLALAVGGFGIGTGEFVTLGLLPNVAHSVHVSIPRAGNLVSAYALGVVVGAPLLAAASVKFSRRNFLVAMAAAMAVGNFASAAAPNFGSLFALRFLTGLPHGAYFGVASVVAASLVTPERRSSAMAVIFAGLTVANIVGVPLATLIGQNLGWRVVFVMVGLIQLLTVLAVSTQVPTVKGEAEQAHILHELNAFRNPQIWFSLGIATIAGGALFCTFSYITPMMTHMAGYPQWAITPLLVIFGLGMTAGVLTGARFADRSLMKTLCAGILAECVISGLFFFACRNKITAAIGIFLFAFTALSTAPALQSRIVTLAGGAPNLAAASIQAAFNISNSLGAWLGGVVIAAGLGYAAPNLAGAGLAAIGLVIAGTSWQVDRRRQARNDDGLPRSYEVEPQAA